MHGVKKYVFPFLDITYNDLLRFMWNRLFLPIANILMCVHRLTLTHSRPHRRYIWDVFVQLIGFVLYIVINLVVTVFVLIMQLIGQLHIMDLFEAYMEIMMPLIQMWISVLQLLIKIGSDLIKKLIPIVVAILKVCIQIIKVLFKIIQWLLVTLFKLLFPLLKAVIAVVKFVIRIFLHKSASFAVRSLLSMKDNLADRFSGEDEALNAANRYETAQLYSTAMRYYSVGQYDGFVEAMDDIHANLRAQEHFHRTGQPLPVGGGVPDYNRHLYEEAELAEHEKGDDYHAGKKKPAPTTAPPHKARLERLQKRRVLSVEEKEDPVLSARNSLLEELLRAHEEAETETPTQANPEDYVEDESSDLDEEEQAMLSHGTEWKANMTREEYYASLPEEDLWRIDLSWNMTSEEVFPLLKGKKLRRARLDSLTKPLSPERLHKRRVLATAYRHAVEHAFYGTHKRHLQHGRFSRYVGKAWRHMTGHEGVESWVQENFGNGRYESVAHWLHSTVPDFTNQGIFKHMKAGDPDKDTRLYWHDWVAQNHPGGLPREYYTMWEAQERYMEEEEYLNTGNGEPSRPMPEHVHHPGNREEMFGPAKFNPMRRRPLQFGADKFEPFSLPLEFLVRLRSF